MRLGDLDALREDWLENGENEYIYDTNSFLASIDEQPTIDPETLPIVQQLREELENKKLELRSMRAAANSLKIHLQKLNTEISDREQCSIEQHAEIHQYRDELKNLQAKYEVLLRLLNGERVESETLMDATGWSFEQCCDCFELNRTAEWWSVIGKTDEERMRNGQKIICYFRIPQPGF